MGGAAAVHGALLDREAELSTLAEMTRAAASGAGCAVLLTGPPGAGKTALIGRIRHHASEYGLHVLSARGTELHQEIPFGVVRELLRPDLIGQHNADLLTGSATLAHEVLTTPEPRPVSPPDLGFTVMHGLFWLTVALAERHPIMLVVDDLQWADTGSLRFLHHLAARVDGLPVLLLMAARTGDATLSVGVVAEIAAQASTVVMPMRPLSLPATARLVRSIAGDEVSDALCEACREASGGNPFYLRELAAEVRRSGGWSDLDTVRSLVPRRIVGSVAVRLEALPPESQLVARAVAVLGDPADLTQVVTVTGLDGAQAARAADGLAAAELLEPGRPLRYVHPVILSAVREGMVSAERSALHRRAAEVAAHEPGGLDRAAAHLLAVDSTGDAWVVEMLRKAARLAATRGAPSSAVVLLRRAMDEGPAWREHGEILLELATVAALAREHQALDLAQQALSLAASPQDRLLAALHVGRMQILCGEPARAIDVIQDALEAAPPGPPADVARGILLVCGVATLGARTRIAPVLDAAVSGALTDDATPMPVCAVAALDLVMGGGTAAQVTGLATRAWGEGALLQQVGPAEPFPRLAIIAAAYAGSFAQAEAWADQLIAMAGRDGAIIGASLGSAFRALSRSLRGDVAGAEADAVVATQFATRTNTPLLDAAACQALALAQLESGRAAEAEETIDALPDTARIPDGIMFPPWVEARARIRLARGRPLDALADLEQSATWERERGAANGAWTMWRFTAVEAHLQLGDVAAAIAVADQALAAARRFGGPLHLGRALRAQALVTEDATERLGLLGEAIAVLDGAGVRLDAVRCRVDRALALEPADRREALEDALARADAMGAALEAERALDALVQSGARPRRAVNSGVRSLTPAERRVAEAVAGERSNREIAEMLFLTTKTVENHLTNIYRKLGIASRAQLAAKLDGG